MNLPHLHLYKSRGKLFAYYRRGKQRIRLRGEVGSPEFLAAYNRAHTATPAPRPGTPEAGTLAALIVAYRASPEWRALAPATRKDYEKGLAALEPYGTGNVREMERHHVRAIRDRAAEGPPSRANKAITVLSILLSYAMEIGWRKDNPAARMPKLKTGGTGYRAWTEEEIAQFLARASGFWRLALLLALCTGQRGQDQVGMTRANYDGTAIRVKELKTASKPERWIPVHPRLKAELDREDNAAGLYLLHRPDGTPWPINAFQKAAGHAIRAAGLQGVVWHGLRPTAATWLAETGCTDAEIQAIIGHITGRMTRHYRRSVDQRKLATAAIAKFKMPDDGKGE